MMCRLLAPFAVLLALLSASAHAQSPEPKRPPLGVAAPSDTEARGLTAGRPPATAPRAAPGALDRAWAWVLEQQQVFRREINAAVTGMKKEPFGSGFFAVVLASFLYGVLHAAGPGHGKGVISSYVLANNQTVRRGILLAFLSAFIQALSAIAIFAVLNLALNARKQDFDTVEAWLATASWALIAVMGAWLLWRQVRPLMSATLNGAPSVLATAGAPGHAHARAGAHDHGHEHAHRHAHGPDCDCGHAHIPSARELEGSWSWPRALSLAFSVGIRPCTGALAVLALTTLNGLFWAGVAATLAMAAGTAITISAIAAMAVGSRDLATRVAGGDGVWASRVSTAAGVAGAAALFALGTAFFFASLRGAGPI